MCDNRVQRKILGSENQEVTRSVRNCIIRSFMTFHLAKCFSRDKIMDYGMGGACSTYKGGDEYLQGFGGEAGKT
jgi:hypothetical protein